MTNDDAYRNARNNQIDAQWAERTTDPFPSKPAPRVPLVALPDELQERLQDAQTALTKAEGVVEKWRAHVDALQTAIAALTPPTPAQPQDAGSAQTETGEGGAGIPEGFVRWEGGECPVPLGTHVEVIYRDGALDEHDRYLQHIAGSIFCRWDHTEDEPHCDIIAYRIVSEAADTPTASGTAMEFTGERGPPTPYFLGWQKGWSGADRPADPFENDGYDEGSRDRALAISCGNPYVPNYDGTQPSPPVASPIVADESDLEARLPDQNTADPMLSASGDEGLDPVDGFNPFLDSFEQEPAAPNVHHDVPTGTPEPLDLVQPLAKLPEQPHAPAPEQPRGWADYWKRSPKPKVDA